jgi:hypothetical protein
MGETAGADRRLSNEHPRRLLAHRADGSGRVERILAGQSTPGFATPSRAFGADFVLEIPGVTRTDD